MASCWMSLLVTMSVATTRGLGAKIQRTSDPYNDVAAINELDTSSMFNLPFGKSKIMLLDVPGPSLSPADFDYQIVNMPQQPGFDNETAIQKTDPTMLAGAFEGDIILASAAELQKLMQPMSQHETVLAFNRNAVMQPDRVWPNREIPYVISSTYNRDERGTIAVAMRNFHLQTCIKFVPRTTHKDYVHIHRGEGCSSSVGRVGGHQSVSLSSGCIYVGIVMHELMHAAGFWHEQSRFDRDNYVIIHWLNIKNGLEYNFQKYDWKTISHLDMSYDLGSIMHYGPRSFAIDQSKKTIEAIDGSEIGQRRHFSKMDIAKLNKLYKCDESVYSKVVTTAVTTTVTNLSSCKNTHDERKCRLWAASGECKKNSAWMHPNCQKSCNTCKEVCMNFNTNCAFWAKSNQCTENTAYMHLYCKQSCGLCHAQSDVSNECVDKNQYCSAWAASGICHTNTAYMVMFCKRSCVDCTPTDIVI